MWKRFSLWVAFSFLLVTACNNEGTYTDPCEKCSDTQQCVEGECVDACSDGLVDCRDGKGCVDLALTKRASCGECVAGYGDCNNDMSDGCEAKLDTAEHCGECAKACEAGGSCSISQTGEAECRVDSCGDGLVDCGDGKGCVDLSLTKRASCGECVAGYGDCNNDMSDGCEVDLFSQQNCGACENAACTSKQSCVSVKGVATCSAPCDPENEDHQMDICYEDITKPGNPLILTKCVKADDGEHVFIMLPRYCEGTLMHSCKPNDGDPIPTTTECSQFFENGTCTMEAGCVGQDECSAQDVGSCDKNVMKNCVQSGDKYYWQTANCNDYVRKTYRNNALEGFCVKTGKTTVGCEAMCTDGTFQFGLCEALLNRISYCNPYTNKTRYQYCTNSCTEDFVDGVEVPVCF